MVKDEILISVYEDEMYKNYARKFFPSLVDEMISETIFSLLLMDEGKLKNLHNNNELKYYCIAIIRNMACNKYSPFRQNYIDENIDIDTIDIVEADNSAHVSSIDVFSLSSRIDRFVKSKKTKVRNVISESELFNMHFKDKLSFRAISKKTGLPLRCLFINIKKTQKEVFNKFNVDYDSMGYE